MHLSKHQRKKILLVWRYDRVGWIEPFVRISKDFDFQFLSFIHKEEDPVTDFDFPRYYWSSFPDAQALLNELKPDAIVFMDLISSSLPISLNITARKKGIPTFIMQHGLYSNLHTYLNLEKISKSQAMDAVSAQLITRANTSGFSSIHFIFKSLLFKSPFQLVRLLIFLKRSKTMGRHHAALYSRFTGLLPDKYIAFTHFNMRLVYERDKVGKDKVIVIGNPYYDIYNDSIENNNTHEKYYLLIDQPMAENKYVNFGVSKERMNNFYLKLNRYALSQNAKLYIKLHPESYNSTYMVEDDNIKYIRDTDLPSLILRAEGCFGCPSTLMVPCIYYKPSILFWLSYMDKENDFSKYNICNLLSFDDFQPEDIRWEIDNDRPVERDLFREHFFYKADGKAAERLSLILSDPHNYAYTSECQL